MNVNLFLYYGALTYEKEILGFMKNFGETDIYSFIMKRNLWYKNVGNNKNKGNLIIGKEIFWDFEFNLFKFKHDKNGLVSIESKTGNRHNFLNLNEENEIKSLLHQIGVHEEPEYYIFMNYEA